jgi:peptidoglycan/LPS O-acetylase OafA/YrhL
MTGVKKSASVSEGHGTALEGKASSVKYNVAIGYLRAFVTVLVLAHHAVLAYHPYAPPAPAALSAQPRWWKAFPIVDSQRWPGFALFVGFNETFFMSLMFLLSGLFVWQSLERKGSTAFLRDRFLRLGVPFLVAAAVLAPLAYYPSYLTTDTNPSLAAFWKQWLSLGDWPAGPAWFLWLLLAFDCVAALLFVLAPKSGKIPLGNSQRPARFFGLLVAVSAAAYIPMVLIFNPLVWASFGPFAFQTSRLFHYGVYFLAGEGIGAYGIERGLLAPDGKLARRWPVWVLTMLVGFAVAAIITVIVATSHPGSQLWAAIGGFAFVLSCAASSFGFLAIFIRFASRRVRVFDSLRDNAYGMYIVHYAFVSWLQYVLLRAPMSAIAKGTIVFLGTLALSWGTTAALRRIPAVARVI